MLSCIEYNDANESVSSEEIATSITEAYESLSFAAAKQLLMLDSVHDVEDFAVCIIPPSLPPLSCRSMNGWLDG